MSASELTKASEELVDSTLLCVWQLLQILIYPLLKQTCQHNSRDFSLKKKRKRKGKEREYETSILQGAALIQ